MSDPREYNYTSSNNGTQASIGSYFTSQQTWKSGETDDPDLATPVNLTNLIMTGNIKIGAIDFPLVEVFAIGETGIFVDADRTLGKYLIQVAQEDTGSFTTDSMGIYDIRYTDATLITKVVNKGAFEFKLTASS